MMSVQKLLLMCLAMGILSCLSAIQAHADPLTFSNLVALQNDGATRVDLFSQPGLTLVGPRVAFLVDITGIVPSAPFQTLSVTFTEAGRSPITQSFEIPFGSVQPPFSLLFSINALGANDQGTNVTLTIDILGSDPDFFNPSNGQGQNSNSYNFKVAQPVPEPASMVLLSLGLVGLVEKRRRNRKRRCQSDDGLEKGQV